MKSPCCLALCLVALVVLPLAATAQGFGRPGFAGPDATDKKDKKDRDDRFGIPHIPVHPTPGVEVPGTHPANSPYPDSRFPPRNGASSPWDNRTFPGTRQPSPEITAPPAAFTPVPPPALRIDPVEFKVPPPEFTMPQSTFSSSFRPSMLAEGRGGVGIIGGIGGGIAAFFRALFGRRKEE
jgi:hypothetical protein